MLFGILGILCGALLGMRLRAFVLIPATGLAWIAIVALGHTLGTDRGSVVAAMLLAGAALQCGYLIGRAMRMVARAARAPAPPDAATPQLPAAE
jgi:hypothetical protein